MWWQRRHGVFIYNNKVPTIETDSAEVIAVPKRKGRTGTATCTIPSNDETFAKMATVTDHE
jgi:hypothetical protein